MKKLTLFLLSVVLLTQVGCGGLAGNYNPEVNSSPVKIFMQVNTEEIGYLYELFATSNSFTKEQMHTLNKGRLVIEAVIEHIQKLEQTGGVSYQDFKANFALATSQYYLMQPIMQAEIDSLLDREPRIIYKNMRSRVEFFISQCNMIINDAEDDIDGRGMDNLTKYGEGFYNALAPLINMAM